MTTATAVCPRGCTTKAGEPIQMERRLDGEVHCVPCGHYDYGPLTDASEFVKEYAMHQPRFANPTPTYTWTYETFFAQPVEKVRVTITYTMKQTGQKSKRMVAVTDNVAGWPWHRWQPPEGESEVNKAFHEATGMNLWALADCLQASGTVGWAERMKANG